MKVKIGSLEVTVETLEELDELVKRYGNTAFEPNTESNGPRRTHDNKIVGGGATDTVLLKKFVEAGSAGLTTTDVGTILGRQGKAARPALKEWGRRIGLTNDDNIEVFEDARVGSQRGMRIKPSLLDVAKHLLNQS